MIGTDGRKSLRRQKHHVGDNYFSSNHRRQKKAKSMDDSLRKRSSSSHEQKPKGQSVNINVSDGNRNVKRGLIDTGTKLLSGSPFDENAEWAEIANIMASFGTGIGTGITGRESSTGEMEASFTSMSKGN